MEFVVQGEIVPFNRSSPDWAAIKKVRQLQSLCVANSMIECSQYYKLGASPSLRGLSAEDERRQIDKIVINMIAIKPVAI
jgi:hypothetical protein